MSSRVIIVGCGHMGLAIAYGLLGAEDSGQVIAVERDAERRTLLQGVKGLVVTDTLTPEPGDLILLAIPPQDFADFAAAEKHKFDIATPTVSVMAGVTVAHIARSLGTDEVVRAIPNTPSEVFSGMTVYFAAPSVSDTTMERATSLLSSIGKTLRVRREELVDDATAICGGGPAFVSYLVDAFCQFAESRGFSDAEGRDMATQVFAGSALLISRSEKPAMQLCREVMTPGGTTERGIAVFDTAQLKSTITAALTASASRSRELAVLDGVTHPETSEC
ncbi:pyrroline-5-carboxylate reductase family protein [Streptomyces polygonati]|uniref:Pyrroline-5-carboxylate reductase n=1 Tax=Streptomyces polygonati TaxID=1617087 RepID=A0ABV8HMV5_9ACTN